MKPVTLFALAALLTAAAPAPPARTYTGVITDTMCVREHAAMKMGPDPKCIRECVGDASTYRYALLTGEHLYTLSDQETPARFAGKRVRVTGVVYEKTRILKLESIEEVR